MFFYTLCLERQCYGGLGLDYFGAFLRLEDLFTKRELAPYPFSWQWRLVSLSCRQYPHVFYIVHFILFFYICSLYLLCCVIDDREHAIDIRKPYVNHFLFPVPMRQSGKILVPSRWSEYFAGLLYFLCQTHKKNLWYMAKKCHEIFKRLQYPVLGLKPKLRADLF